MKTKTILIFAAALAAAAFISAADFALSHPGGSIDMSGTCTVEEKFAGRVPSSPWGNSTFVYNPKFILVRVADGAVLADVEVPVATEQWWGSQFDFSVTLGNWPAGEYVLRTQVGRRQFLLSGEGWYGFEATLSTPIVTYPETWTAFDEPQAWQYGTWAPDPSTVDYGTSYTQSRTNTRWHRTGERSNLGNERGVGGYTESVSESRAAVGTRRIATTFSFGNLTHTYNGTAKSATVTANPAAATFTSSLNGGINAGTYTVSATANGNYTGSGSATLTIARADQSITFANPGGKTYGDAPFALSGSASSGIPVTFTLLSGPATLSGSTVTLTGSGNVTIRASQAGNSNWAAAANVDQTFTVAAGAPAMTLNMASLAFGNVRVNTGTPTTSSITFRITNTGYGPLTIDAISFGNGDYTVIGLNGGAVTFPRTLNPAQNGSPAEVLDVTVMFNPSAIGSRNTTMMVTNNSANANALTTVTGLGQDPALRITWGPVRSIP